MQLVHLDYEKKYRPLPALGLVMLLAAVAGGVQMARHYEYLSGIRAGWEALEARVERIARQHDVSLGDRNQNPEHMAREVGRANEVLRRITLPWDDLFGAVESAAPGEVALLAMEPDPERQVLKISGEAKNVPAMLEYIRMLESRPLFRSVTLHSHQVQVQDPQRPLRFAVDVAWREAR
jgi:Tfp pilus assembly protein PilN